MPRDRDASPGGRGVIKTTVNSLLNDLVSGYRINDKSVDWCECPPETVLRRQDGGEGGFRDVSRGYREADFVTALAASAQREPRDPLGHREGPRLCRVRAILSERRGLNRQYRASARSRRPPFGRSVNNGANSTGDSSAGRKRHFRASEARIRTPSIHANRSPMQRRGPPPKG